ncbi:hypothetical protein, partial [Gilvimarinus sp. 1_MG-2023]
ASPSQSSRQFEVLLAGITVSNVDLRWQQPGIQTRITADNMTVGLINSAENLPVELAGALQIAALRLTQPQAVTLNQPLVVSWQGSINDWRRDPELTGDLTLKHLD